MDQVAPFRNNSLIVDGHAILADRVFDGHGWHADAAVLIRDGRIIGLGQAVKFPPIGCSGRRFPGSRLIVQINGGGGILLNDQPTADGMRAIARAHRRYGPWRAFQR